MQLFLPACLALSLGAGAFAQTVTVFAASSLTDAFTEVAATFEGMTAGVEVVLNFASSSILSAQLLQGAPADLFASADEVQLERVVAAGLVAAEPRVFALNLLTVITPEGSDLADPVDLERPGTLVVLAAPEVPVGRYARELLSALEGGYGLGFAERVLSNLASEEPNARQTAAKVALGEADAAIVYRTDTAGLAGVRELPLPPGASPVAHYPIAPLNSGRSPKQAASFTDFLLSAQGQAILARHGFLAP